MSNISIDERNTFDLFISDISRDLLSLIADHANSKEYIASYTDYPISTKIDISTGWPRTNILSPYDFFSYRTNGYQYADYSTLLSIRNENDKICLYEIDKFEEFRIFVSEKENILSRIWYSKNIDRVDIALYILLGNIINRYIAITGRYEYVDETFHEIYNTVINAYFLEKLEFNICVPLLFVDFEDEFIPISESVYIKKMTYDFMQSKYFIGNYDGLFERIVIECATHMLVLEGYNVDNESYLTEENFGYMGIYPTKIIDTVFSSIRSLTNFPTGYAQFVVLPTNNWIAKHNKGNLLGLEGVKARAFPGFFLEYFWLKSHNLITAELGKKLTALASNLISREDNTLQVACNRLNRSMLRNSDEDTVLDAIIGLEVLLSDNDKGELTYKIATRMATISILMPECPFSTCEIQKSVIQIYRYRSDIVHSRKPRPATELIKIRPEVELSPVDLSIKYLSMAIEILADNPEYLDSKKIDEFMMKKLGE